MAGPYVTSYTGANTYSTYYPSYAVDGNKSNRWVGTPSPCSLTCNLSADVTINALVIAPYYSTSIAGAPVDLFIEHRVGASTWVRDGTWSGVTWPYAAGAFYGKAFTFPAATASVWRVTFTSPATMVQVAELRLSPDGGLSGYDAGGLTFLAGTDWHWPPPDARASLAGSSALAASATVGPAPSTYDAAAVLAGASALSAAFSGLLDGEGPLDATSGLTADARATMPAGANLESVSTGPAPDAATKAAIMAEVRWAASSSIGGEGHIGVTVDVVAELRSLSEVRYDATSYASLYAQAPLTSGSELIFDFEYGIPAYARWHSQSSLYAELAPLQAKAVWHVESGLGTPNVFWELRPVVLASTSELSIYFAPIETAAPLDGQSTLAVVEWVETHGEVGPFAGASQLNLALDRTTEGQALLASVSELIAVPPVAPAQGALAATSELEAVATLGLAAAAVLESRTDVEGYFQWLSMAIFTNTSRLRAGATLGNVAQVLLAGQSSLSMAAQGGVEVVPGLASAAAILESVGQLVMQEQGLPTPIGTLPRPIVIGSVGGR